MGKNTGNKTRKGCVKNRTQVETPSGVYMKRDTKTGRFVSGKKTPYKGVRSEKKATK